MSGYTDPYCRSGYEYRERDEDRSPTYDFERECRERDREYGARDREYGDREYGSDNGYRGSRYRDRSRSRSLSRSRSRSRSASRSPRDYDRRERRHRHRRSRESSRERSYSRERKYRDDDSDKYSSSRERYYDERRDERRRRSYDDDRSSRGSYDSGKSPTDRYRDDGRYGRGVKDEWLAHVWGDGNRPDVSSGMEMDMSMEHYDKSSYKLQVPNKTLIIRGLGPSVTERDIREEIIRAGGNPRDIRLIRKKDTGSSRGFAFVEFYSVEEARSMVEKHDGEFRLLGQKVIMQYSIQRDFDKEPNSDWYCRCCALNFKRREFCYRCGSDRKTGECSESDENSLHPTHTVMLKGLDVLTTEENVLKTLQTLSSLPIRSVRIGRDKITNMSKGICYLEMNNVSDAMYLHNTLLTKKPRIDGRIPYVSYCKNVAVSTTVASAAASNAGNAAIAAAQWSHQKNEASRYTVMDVPKLADYSASLYAKTPSEHEAYVKHYTDYYTKVINEGGTVPSLNSIGSNPSSTGFQREHTAAAAVNHQHHHPPTLVSAPSSLPIAPRGELPSGSGDTAYPVPDVSTYQYDKTSGYYYDPYTTLYYDANSQYYFNSKISKYLYWDGVKRTYLLAPTSSAENTAQNNANAAAATPASDAKCNEDEKKGKDKADDKDKVKVAKRIAKDMEKWAKTLNHKKEIAKQNLVASQVAPVLKAQGAADIGYVVSVLGKKDCSSPLSVNPYITAAAAAAAAVPGTAGQSASDSLVAEYGQGSDSEEDNEDLQQDDKHVDWTKMACLLCKRAFPNKETLLKHQQLSDLHKQNLEAWYRSTGISMEDAKERSVLYRDRAKERRTKYNEPDVPPSNRLKENYMKAREASVNYEQPTKHRIGGDNVGNKLLQKMGWQEGMGLGKKNQGRTDIIQAEARPMSAGLGIRTQGVTPGPGETYKDCVKKMMRARYEEIDNR